VRDEDPKEWGRSRTRKSGARRGSKRVESLRADAPYQTGPVTRLNVFAWSEETTGKISRARALVIFEDPGCRRTGEGVERGVRTKGFQIPNITSGD
jgi:hypothetical protein